jgi:hypothetical protein
LEDGYDFDNVDYAGRMDEYSYIVGIDPYYDFSINFDYMYED